MKNFSSADCRCFKRQHFYGYIYLRCQQRLHTDPFVSATSQRWTDGQEPQATNIGGDNFWPLNEDQIQEFHEAAAEADKKMEELVGLGLLYTGMRNAELHHMRPDWLEYSDQGSLRIVIPIEEECIGGAGRSGKNNEDERNPPRPGRPCSHCRTSTSDWFKKKKRDPSYSDKKWHPKSEAGHRIIPVHEGDAVEVLEWWFDGHDQIPVLHNGVNRRIEKIVDRIGLKRRILIRIHEVL